MLFGRKPKAEAQPCAVSSMRRLQGEVEAIAAIADDPRRRGALNEFAGDLRYSDPVGNPQLGEIEERLADCIQLLRECVENGDGDVFAQRLEKAKRLLNERNRLCRASK